MTVLADAQDRAIACLLTGAIGDALGAAVEFDSRAAILARYGPDGIRHPDVAYGRLGAVTDDTQMTLVLADSVVRAGSGDALFAAAARGHLRWFSTQEPGAAGADGPPWGDEELFATLHRQGRRGPGATCLASLAGQSRPPRPVVNDRKGCGTVMRVAPVGLYVGAGSARPSPAMDRQAYAAGMADAVVTHGHPTARHASGFVAVLVARALHGESLSDALGRTLAGWGTDDLAPLCRRARELAAADPDPERLAELGQGWTAEEDLAIGLYAALQCERRAVDAADALRLAVNHDGDSDSTGSLAGQLIGAFSGAVPEELMPPGSEPAELRPLIVRLATGLVSRQTTQAGAPAGEAPA